MTSVISSEPNNEPSNTPPPSSPIAEPVAPESKSSEPEFASPLVEATKEPEWRQSIPEEFKDHPVVKNVKDIGGLVKSLVHAQSMVGKDKFIVPGENATDDDWSQVYAKLGRPENKDKYEFEKPTDMDLDENMFNGFKEAAFANGLSQKQASALFSWYNQQNQNSLESVNKASQEKIKQDLNKLQGEWGSAYNDKVTLAKKGARHLEEKFPELESLFAIPEVGSHPGILKLLSETGSRVSEGSLGRADGGGHYGITPAEAKEKANAIIANYDANNNPYYNGSHPNHEAEVKKVQELLKIANSSSQPGSAF